MDIIENPSFIENHEFESQMKLFGFSARTQRVLTQFGFKSIKEVRDFVNDNGLSALRLAKAGFGRIVCEEIAKLPFIIQTFEEAKKLLPLTESMQIDLEKYDLIMEEAKKRYPDFETFLEEIRGTIGYIKLDSKKNKI